MIVLYKGRRGSGKSLTMVRDAYRFKKNGWRILSNISLSFGEVVDSDFILSLSRESDLNNACLVVDEIEVFFDSRSFKGEKQKAFSHFLQQIRKRNIVILCTAQYTNLVDLRLRQQIDFLACPDFRKGLFSCKVVYYDVTSLESFNEPTSITNKYPVSPVFSMYDTFEMVA